MRGGVSQRVMLNFTKALYDRTVLPLQAVWQLKKLRLGRPMGHYLKSMPYVGEYVYRKAHKSELARLIARLADISWRE